MIEQPVPVVRCICCYSPATVSSHPIFLLDIQFTCSFKSTLWDEFWCTQHKCFSRSLRDKEVEYLLIGWWHHCLTSSATEDQRGSFWKQPEIAAATHEQEGQKLVTIDIKDSLLGSGRNSSCKQETAPLSHKVSLYGAISGCCRFTALSVMSYDIMSHRGSPTASYAPQSQAVSWARMPTRCLYSSFISGIWQFSNTTSCIHHPLLQLYLQWKQNSGEIRYDSFSLFFTTEKEWLQTALAFSAKCRTYFHHIIFSSQVEKYNQHISEIMRVCVLEEWASRLPVWRQNANTSAPANVHR